MSYLPDTEQHFIGLLLNNPSVWPEVNLIAPKDFMRVRQPLMEVMRQQLDQTPPASVTPVILMERLKSYAVNDFDGIDVLTYLNGLEIRGRLLKTSEAINLLKELKEATATRELIEACEKAKVRIKEAKSFSEKVEAVTKTLASVQTEFFKSGDTEDMFAGMRDEIEQRGNSDDEQLGYIGVLPSIDRTVGPLLAPAGFCNISARSGVGKSSFGFFYAVSTVEKYEDMNLLWLDSGEMTLQQLQFRAAACFSKGRVPLWALRSGQWRKKQEWVDIIRGEVWPRVQRLVGRCAFKNVSGMTAKEKVNFMRRHYHAKVGSGRFLAIVDDYLKGMESLNKETKEYQSIGYYTSDVKNLVTDEINGGYMTFTQSNRYGIVKGKKAEEIQDNDNQISISDRIKDNCTTNWILRFKVMDELSREKNAFGNVVLKNLKVREGLGRDFESFIRPIKVGNTYVDDYFNLDFHGFHYRDMGLHSEMLAALGHTAIDLSSDKTKREMP